MAGGLGMGDKVEPVTESKTRFSDVKVPPPHTVHRRYTHTHLVRPPAAASFN